MFKTVGEIKAVPLSFTDSGTDQADDGIGTSDDDETNSNSSTHEERANSPNMAQLQARRVIKLDLAAMSQLLTFDEVRKSEIQI